MAAFIDKEYSVQMREQDRAYIAAVALLHPEKVIDSQKERLLPKPRAHVEPIEVSSLRTAAMFICKKYSVHEIDLLGPSRSRCFNEARSEFVGLCKTKLGKSYNQIGTFMNNRNHTTILNYFNMYRAAHPGCEMLEAA